MITTSIRWITGTLLAYLSITPIQHGGHERVVGGAEILAAILFVLPRVWRIGGALLLAIIAIVFTVHSVGGHPPLMLIFPALTIIMLMVPR
ncbi:MAG TPA: hypothetical protein VJ853_10185 [Thermoanaerobaculia bacterium]|nr:hypothetical protein [Thermoanaerobaculia bacterium]